MTTPRVVITRAEDDAASWQRWFAQHAITTYHVPFLRMQTLAPDSSWLDWWDRVGTGDAVFFVSAQAVRSAVDALGQARWARLLQQWQAGEGPRCWAPGPATAAALHAVGAPAQVVDAPLTEAEQLDSEHLWPVVQHQVQPGMRLMLARGRGESSHQAQGEGRDWLANRCAQAGAHVTAVAVYQRGLALWSPAQHQAWQQACADGHAIWLVSSALALHGVPRLTNSPAWWSRARLLATHPRVAAAAVAMAWGQVKTCSGQRDAVQQAVMAWDDLPTIKP